MKITVMDFPTSARYVIHPSSGGGPLGLDVTAVPDTPQPFMKPPTVPYIYRLFYVDPETKERREYQGTTEFPACPSSHTGATGENDEAEWNERLEWEMEMCAPFMSLDRPEKFEGPGVIVMKKFHRPEVRSRVDKSTGRQTLNLSVFDSFVSLAAIH